MRLSAATECYLRAKRANGLLYETEAAILSSFLRRVGDLNIEEITSKEITEFLDIRQCSNRRRMVKHSCLRMLFEFWTDHGQMPALLIPRLNRRSADHSPASFVYTRTELQRLIRATHEIDTRSLWAMSEATFRIILLFLYGTGAKIGEVLWLGHDDLDLKRNLVFLRGDRKILPRRIPFGKDLHEELRKYLHSEERRSMPPGSNVFVSKRGEPLRSYWTKKAFARLRARAGIVRVDRGMHRPRMQDLRQTFAVHRIASWIKEGADLNSMLPALSAYLGFSGFDSIQRLLRMTPERFKSALDELSPYKGRKHWRDDPGLMRFLETL